MRILHCTDFHSKKVWFDWLVDQAPHYDLVCLTGDHLDLFEIHRIDDQLRMVKAALRRITTPLALCSGNHDSFNGPPAPISLLRAVWLNDLRRPGLWSDGDAFMLDGLRLRCIGWDALLPTSVAEEIWLFHAPPASSLVASGSDESEAGDEILDQLCLAGEGPQIVLSGHQHNPRRWACRVGSTWCLNPGHNSHATVPNHIVIDTRAKTASLRIDNQTRATVALS